MVPASTARSWRSRFASRAGVLRDRLAGLLPQVSGEEAARPAAPSGSPSGDCLAVLDAVTRGLRRFPGMAGLAACEAAAHLSAALWLAPAGPSLPVNPRLLPVAAAVPAAARDGDGGPRGRAEDGDPGPDRGAGPPDPGRAGRGRAVAADHPAVAGGPRADHQAGRGAAGGLRPVPGRYGERDLDRGLHERPGHRRGALRPRRGQPPPRPVADPGPGPPPPPPRPG